jgi:hypothetical protein
VSPPLYRCGHPRTVENTRRNGEEGKCRTCARKGDRKYVAEGDPAVRRMQYRQRYLPIALERTREKLRELEREACALGLTELLDEPKRLTGNQILSDPQIVDRAWEREAEIARIVGRL